MKRNFLILTTGVLLGLSAVSCNSHEKDNSDKVEKAEEKVEEAKEDLTEARQEVAQEYENYKAEMQARIDANDKKIEELRAKAKDQPEANREHYKAQIQELKDKNEALRKRINDYQAQERKEEWAEFKREFNHDMEQLEQSISDTWKNNVK